MIDLSVAVNCLNIMKSRGNRDEYKIGMIKEECGGLSMSYDVGEIVLFRESEDNSNRLTIESPMTQEAINEEGVRGSYITTLRTIVWVPSKYVEEIRI